jgi:hypothetical protein
VVPTSTTFPPASSSERRFTSSSSDGKHQMLHPVPEAPLTRRRESSGLPVAGSRRPGRKTIAAPYPSFPGGRYTRTFWCLSVVRSDRTTSCTLVPAFRVTFSDRSSNRAALVTIVALPTGRSCSSNRPSALVLAVVALLPYRYDALAW